MGRRSDHSRDEIREMALSAAERILAEEGVASLTTRKVAAAIGYTVGSLYLVFENLDDLILHVNGRTLDELYRSLQATAAECDEPRACLEALGFTYIRFAAEHGSRWRVMFNHRLAHGESLPPWYRNKVMCMFALVEQQLGAQAPRRSAQDIALAARALWSGVHGICVLHLGGSLDTAGIDSLHALVDSLIANYLTGFTGSPIAGPAEQ